MGAKYKVGDKVTIKKTRKYSSDDYRFSFTDLMLNEFGGKEYTIALVNKAELSSDRAVPDDGYTYTLKEVGFTWASSMFEDEDDEKTLIVDSLSSSSCVSDNDIDVFVKKRMCPKLDFNL